MITLNKELYVLPNQCSALSYTNLHELYVVFIELIKTFVYHKTQLYLSPGANWYVEEILTNISLTYFEAFPGTKVKSNYSNKLSKMP